MDRLIKLEPSNQVVIRIEPGQRCYGSLTLRNIMHTMPVAFRLRSLNRIRFKIRPQTAIIAPLSTIRIEITYLHPQLIPDTVPRSEDSFYLDSVICVGASSNAVTPSWFNGKNKEVFTDTGLRVFYVGSAVLARLMEEGDMEKVREVLEQSDPDWRAADSTDARGRTLLQIAIVSGRADLVQLLLEFGADVDAPSRGRSPMEIAAVYGHTIIAELLLARGASTARSQRSDYGPLHLAAAAGHSELVRMLLMNGAEVDEVATDGQTALNLAVVEKQRDCEEILMSAGEEWHQRFFGLMIADVGLMGAARRGDVRALRGAIDIGASVDARDERGWTALMVAAFKGWMEVIRVLLEKGAEIDARDEEGYTALHCAVEAGQSEAVEVLVKSGADLEVRTAKGKTAMEIAGALGYVGFVRMLERAGAAKMCEKEAVVEDLWPVLGKEEERKGKKNGNRIAVGGGGGGGGGMGRRAGFLYRTGRWRSTTAGGTGGRVCA